MKILTLIILACFLLAFTTSSPKFIDDIYVRVLLNEVPNASIVTINGSNHTVANGTLETVWAESTPYTFPPSAQTMKVSSANANDTSAGTGARTILITCLDSNYDSFNETVTLNGQTEVSMAAQCLRINAMTVMTAGSGGNNAGIIYVGTGTVTNGKPATVYGLIEASENRAHHGFYTIPRGYKGFVKNLILSGETSKTVEFQAQVRDPALNNLLTDAFELHSGGEAVTIVDNVPPRAIGEKSDFMFNAKGIGAIAEVEILVTLLLVAQ